MTCKTRRRGITIKLGMAAGAALAAGLIPIASAGAAWADEPDPGITVGGGGSGGVSTPIGGGRASTGGSGAFNDNGGGFGTGTSGGLPVRAALGAALPTAGGGFTLPGLQGF